MISIRALGFGNNCFHCRAPKSVRPRPPSPAPGLYDPSPEGRQNAGLEQDLATFPGLEALHQQGLAGALARTRGLRRTKRRLKLPDPGGREIAHGKSPRTEEPGRRIEERLPEKIVMATDGVPGASDFPGCRGGLSAGGEFQQYEECGLQLNEVPLPTTHRALPLRPAGPVGGRAVDPAEPALKKIAIILPPRPPERKGIALGFAHFRYFAHIYGSIKSVPVGASPAGTGNLGRRTQDASLSPGGSEDARPAGMRVECEFSASVTGSATLMRSDHGHGGTHHNPPFCSGPEIPIITFGATTARGGPITPNIGPISPNGGCAAPWAPAAWRRLGDGATPCWARFIPAPLPRRCPTPCDILNPNPSHPTRTPTRP